VATIAQLRAHALPLALLLVPKCPLCLVPIAALLGIAAPGAPLLHGVVVTAVVIWAAVLAAGPRPMRTRALALGAAAVVIAARVEGWVAPEVVGVLLMIAITSVPSPASCPCD
jgi:hypothetical protein